MLRLTLPHQNGPIAMAWSDTFPGILKENDVPLISCVPGNVLASLIKGVTADNYFLSVNATREDEALGTVTGAYTQTSPPLR
jgi:sulfopyruvate decarboxylase TPP-binding subunit